MSAFKVGDRVRVITDAGGATAGDIGVITSISSNDSDDHLGRYFTIDGLSNGVRGLYEARLVPVAEATGTLRIETGRYYRTRDGRKVGPMVRIDDGEFVWESPDCYYGEDGSAVHLDKSNDIIAEWIDEPAVAPATAKFKVGDRVENAIPKNDYDKPGTVTEVTDEGYRVHWDNDPGAFSIYWYDNELRLVAPATSGNAIVAPIENGQPKPSHRPYVHASREAAETEATRLAGKHPGKEFGVYELVATKREAKAYDFEWQRLAAGGQKIAAIKSLRGITGLISLRSAKTAVEDFLRPRSRLTHHHLKTPNCCPAGQQSGRDYV